ncbi:MAG TPA: amino acid adenylation domain-containing protein, partial [Chthoniobacterales bacterium]|nr:amino acid adenylation domain-containing protein [Chthoniobacterales bacterium]
MTSPVTGTGTAYPQNNSIPGIFEEQVEKTPDAIALIAGDQELTFRELNDRASQLAHYLRELGAAPETLVGLCLSRSAEMVVALLGILKAGAAYLPLDPVYPVERLAFILEDTKATILIIEDALARKFPQYDGILVCTGKERGKITRQSTENPANAVSPDNAAYVIYTSGSSGKPKGVAITHHNAETFLSWAHGVFSPSDLAGVLASSSISFDLSVFEIFAPLTCGGKVILVQDALAIAGVSGTSDISLVNTVPSAMAELLRLNAVPPSVSTINLAGEPVRSGLVDDIYSKTSARSVYDLYGPTEATTYSSFALRVPAGPQTIGKPISNTQIYILDRDLQPAPIGVPGELHIGGAGVARGYLNRPELTAERFIPNPFSRKAGERLYKTGDLGRYMPDGDLELLGRADDQVKVRGFRIEPGEIEAALDQHPGVKHSVVVAHGNDASEKQLVAYIVATEQLEPAISEIDAADFRDDYISDWEMVFEETFAQAKEPEDPTTNTAGVNSSYTSAPVPASEARDWVDHAANRILSLNPNRVLDIGCGLGRTLFRVAPGCSIYWGTDISQVALNYVEQHLGVLGNKREVVKLLRARASDFSIIPARHFDTIIINGVVQYLPHIDHLLEILKNALNALEPGGVIFVGDVRSSALFEAFHLSVELAQTPDTLSTNILWQRLRNHIADEKELVIDSAFFEVMPNSLSGISSADILLKRGWAQNELTRFRYDAILYTEPQQESALDVPWLDWVEQNLTFAAVRERLAHKPEALGITGVPNARVLPEVRAADHLRSGDGPAMALELRHGIETMRKRAVHPEAFWDLEDELPYSVDITWSHASGPGFFDVILRRRHRSDARRLPAIFQKKAMTPKAWRDYAHNPIDVKLRRA